MLISQPEVKARNHQNCWESFLAFPTVFLDSGTPSQTVFLENTVWNGVT
jgi:hypothetical protein